MWSPTAMRRRTRTAVAGPPASTRRQRRPRGRAGRRGCGGGAWCGSLVPPSTRQESIIGGDEGGSEVIGRDLPSVRKPCPCDADPLGFVARARRAGRREERRIGLDEHAIERD